MIFRQDINALRALAVSLVILFHFGVPCFEGGFVGVDVFFVLSGYLMTKAIVPALKSGRFEFCSFYHARAKRIIPALLVLCVVVTLFGYFCLPVDEFRTLGREVK
ncbi:TPA: acyltransferase family protein, partial [Pseudomonas aeruginosa]